MTITTQRNSLNRGTALLFTRVILTIRSIKEGKEYEYADAAPGLGIIIM